MTRKSERNGMGRRRQQRQGRERAWELAMDLMVEHGFDRLARASESETLSPRIVRRPSGAMPTAISRGLHGVRLITSDDHKGLEAARTARFPGVPWQRCQFHLGKNMLDYLTPGLSQSEASADLRAIFNAANRVEAERLLGLMVKKYASLAPKLASWLEQNVPEGLTVFDFPVEHRRRLRTNNGLERLNREIKRRTRVATLFPNEASLLRLATAVLMEVDEEWQTEKRYLPKATPQPASTRS